MVAKKYPFYFYIIAALLPLLFFVLLELALRLFNFGQAVPQWVPAGKPLTGYIMLNPEIARRYFHRVKTIPTPPCEPFRREKQANGIRVFIMGESSAAGFPYPNTAAFSRYIRHYLQARYPDCEIEVINLAFSAICSYTLADLLPGVIAYKPDLLIFYAGHNEYYGALGAGSAEFLGSYQPLVKFMISIQDIRTVQLVQRIIIGIAGIFSTEQRSPDETLMARMAGEQQILLHSDVYKLGISQFKGNMEDMLDLLTRNKIPVLLGTLTCNLKDQAPFISLQADSLPAASAVFRQAEELYRQGNYTRALNLFRRARDLDCLRFRAPGEINDVIRQLGIRYRIPVVDIDSVFCRAGNSGIPGNALILDHVHPNSGGHKLIGSAFSRAMEQCRQLPDGARPAISFEEAQQEAGKIETITRLDSVLAFLRISFLKSGWPFRPGKMPGLTPADFTPRDYADELALSMFLEEINWELAHLKAGLWYKEQNRISEFEKELAVLVDYLPLPDPYFMILIDGLLEKKNIEVAYPYILQMQRHHAGAYSSKWLGIYYLYTKNYQQAVALLEYSAGLNAADSQLQYNLAGAYLYLNRYDRALQAVNKCLSLQKDFPGAAIMQRDLLRITAIKGK